jgi:transposase
MNTIYIGVDFHARQQTICYLTTADGEVQFFQLEHHDKAAVRSFYAQFSGQVIVGLEASGYSPWFEDLLAELGCEVWLGNAREIRRRARSRHKNDRRDAELILDLMLHHEFPRLYVLAAQSREVLRMLRYRQKLIKMRTIAKNSVQALALQSGLAKGAGLFSKSGLQELRQAPMSPAMQWQLVQWLQLLEALNERSLEVMRWLKQQSLGDERIGRLRTHPGIGLLTALCLVHALEPVRERFRNSRRVVGFAGLDPLDDSSAERIRFGAISKAGPRVLRFLVIEAAHISVKHDDDLKRFYKRLVGRRGKPKAKIAVGRKLLVRAYIMLRDEIDYAEFKRRAVAARLARENPRTPCLSS